MPEVNLWFRLLIDFLNIAMHISHGHTTDFYLGKTDLPKANSQKNFPR